MTKLDLLVNSTSVAIEEDGEWKFKRTWLCTVKNSKARLLPKQGNDIVANRIRVVLVSKKPT
jgi:hypothetical protein